MEEAKVEKLTDMRITTIAVDVDGVLAEQVIPVLERIRDKYGISLNKEQITEWDYRIGNTDIKTEIELAETEESFVKAMQPIEGCREALDILAESHCVVVATARSPLTNAWTQEWLKNNHIKYHRLINTHADGKSLPEAHILIDDYIGNIQSFVASGNDKRKAILFAQPWNSRHDSLAPYITAAQVYVALGWDAVIQILTCVAHANCTYSSP